jgi:hypothetical protein
MVSFKISTTDRQKSWLKALAYGYHYQYGKEKNFISDWIDCINEKSDNETQHLLTQMLSKRKKNVDYYSFIFNVLIMPPMWSQVTSQVRKSRSRQYLSPSRRRGIRQWSTRKDMRMQLAQSSSCCCGLLERGNDFINVQVLAEPAIGDVQRERAM